MKKFLENITSGKSDFMVFGKKSELGEDPKVGILSWILHQIYELNRSLFNSGNDEQFYCFPNSVSFVESDEQENCSVSVGEIGIRLRFEKENAFPVLRQKELLAYFKERVNAIEELIALLNLKMIEEGEKREWLTLYKNLIDWDACYALCSYLFLPMLKHSKQRKLLRKKLDLLSFRFMKELLPALKKQKREKMARLKSKYLAFLENSTDRFFDYEVHSIFSMIQEQYGIDVFIAEECCCHEEGEDCSHHHHNCGCGC